MKPFFVYLLRCADGSYYAGHTDDLERRVAEHQSGAIEGYTHERRPVELMWAQETATREEALGAELRIKGWSRAKKEALMVADWERVTLLARSKGGLFAERPAASSGRSEMQARPVRGQGERNHSGASTRPALPSHPARPEPVKGAFDVAQDGPFDAAQDRLRQAQPERGEVDVRVSFSVDPAHPEPVEGPFDVAQDRPFDVAQGRPSIESLTAPILRRERRALAKAITLLESTRADHRARADALLNTLLPHTGKAMRLGISGVPGVGKSTFIEALGLMLIAQGHRVAVLAIDPSSSLGGGSILGDKTRMEHLSVNEAAYIRPSPASGTLGGVAEKTREAMLVCEAAGYDVVIVETVGVGQSETAVASMTDMFVLLQLPNAGDDLQAIKKGVMEIADLVVINKADIDPGAATRAQAYISSSLRLFGGHGHAEHWSPQVMALSALKGEGLAAFWTQVQTFHRLQRADGAFDARRKTQSLAWMWDIVHARLQADFRHHPAVRDALPHTVRDVTEARVAPSAAARSLLNLFERPQR